MGIFDVTANHIIVYIIMIMSCLSAMFFFAIFFIGRSRGFLMIALSNTMQIAMAALLLALADTGHIWILVLVNIMSIPLALFWINSVFLIFNIKASGLIMAGAAAAYAAIATAVYLMSSDIHIINVMSAYAMSSVTVYGAYKSYKGIKDVSQTSLHLFVTVSSMLALLNIARGTYRMFNPLDFTYFGLINQSAAIFILVAFIFSLLVNYSIMFLNYSHLINKVQALSGIDQLTGAVSKSTFSIMLKHKMAEIKRLKRGVCVALLDLDNFKRINDTYGHLAGDEALRIFSRIIKDNIRENDVYGRFGGEEFLLMLEADSCDEATYALTRLQDKLKKEAIFGKEQLTFSCGHLYINEQNANMSVDEIIKDIDKKMYRAKSLGKDLVL